MSNEWSSTGGGVFDDYVPLFDDSLPEYAEEDQVLPRYNTSVSFPDALQQSGTLDLTISARSVSGTSTPAEPLYYLSKPIDSTKGPISFCLYVPPGLELDGSPRHAQHRELYKLSAFPYQPLSRSPHICRIKGHTDRGCFGRCALYINNTLKGISAEVVVEGKLKIKYGKQTWRDTKGRILAVESKLGESRGLKIREGVDPKIRDLLVASACARSWVKATAPTFGKEADEIMMRAVQNGEKAASKRLVGEGLMY